MMVLFLPNIPIASQNGHLLSESVPQACGAFQCCLQQFEQYFKVCYFALHVLEKAHSSFNCAVVGCIV